jgi:hypothetical protein
MTLSRSKVLDDRSNRPADRPGSADGASGVRAQSPAAAGGVGVESEENLLAEQVDDSTAILTQLKFQALYTPRNFQSTADTNTFQIRPVIPQ